MTQGSSAIGGSGRSTTTGNMHYSTPPAAVGNNVRDGDQFILLVKSRQSEEFKVWSSGDPAQTKDLFSQARRQVDELTTA